MASTGYTWEYIDDFMTLPRLHAMSKYWSDHPPAHLILHSIAIGLFGLEAKKRKSTDNKTEDQDPSELMAMLGIGLTSEKPEWLMK